MTGGQAGDCADDDTARLANPMLGRGYGRGRAGQRGRRWWRGRDRRRRRFHARRHGPGRSWRFSSRLTPEQELEELEDKAGWLKEQLDAVNQRIGEIGK